MNIGILTMHYRRNYGGILQSYALYNVLKQMGHQVKIIDYKNPNNFFDYHPLHIFPFICNKISALASLNNQERVTTKPLNEEVLAIFREFKKKYLRYTQPVNNKTIENIIDNFDALIVGSDQVWNSMNQRKLIFFFDFNKKYNGLKIAYAPCSIYPNSPKYNRKKLSALLTDFDSISVRDNTTAKLVNNTACILPQKTLDPTCLWSFSEFTYPKKIDGDYIFAYILGSEIEGGYKQVLEKIFSKYGKMKVISIVISDVSLESEKFSDKVLYTASPRDWVNLLANAKFVFTDSFHGCMFALKFNKNFIAYYKEKTRASRLIDVRDTFGLQNRIVDSVSSMDLDCKINFFKVNALLSHKREESINFLKRALALNK